MEIEKVSETRIKPSSPTPSYLRAYKISLIDQFLVQYGIDIPLTLFYSNHQRPDPATTAINNDDFISKRSQLLKQSLSATLTYYYPLAGRIEDHLSVDCNDEGVYYVVAQANISISECFSHPDYLTICHSLFPRQPSSYEPLSPGACVVMIQETSFACGSFSIAIFGSHMVMDVAPMASFIKTWAATACNNDQEIIFPNFDGPSIFPQHQPFPREATMAAFDEPFLKTGKLATRRFVFDFSTVEYLQKKAANSSLESPAPEEVVSAFLVECIWVILEGRSSNPDRPIAFAQIVDFRRKSIPPIPESSLGNFFWMAPGILSPKENALTSIVCKIREATSKIDADFVNNIRKDGAFTNLYEMMKETRKTFSNGGDFVMISSLCKLGLYEIDFGWGKPIWASCIDLPPDSTMCLNSIVLTDSETEKGIEAWVFMDEQDIVLLEKYEKLMEYASVNPSPLSN